MRILAFNGSPRGKAGNTDRILQQFLAGAGEAGAETETVYLKDKKIEPCRGCFSCWTKTPGTCIHRDDMPELLAKMRLADVLVCASPLYVFTVSGLMKDFMDRMLPLADPHMINRDGRFVHPPRYGEDRGGRLQKTVLISNCGYPERHHFGGLVETFRLLTAGPDEELAAAILCAGGELLGVEQLQESIRWYLEAAREAGREFAQTGGISPGTQEALDRLLVDPEVYARMANSYWDSLIVHPAKADNQAPPEENGLVPLAPVVLEQGRLPADFREAVAGQAVSFNPRTAGDLCADIQFRAAGDQGGDFVLRIAEGRCQAYEGTVPTPALTIRTPGEVWLKIARGELNGRAAYMKGLYTIEGDAGLLLRMNELFSPGDETATKGAETPGVATVPPVETRQRGPLRLPAMTWLGLTFVPWWVNWVAGALPQGPWRHWAESGLPLVLAALIWGYRRVFGQSTLFETGTLAYYLLAFLVTIAGSGFFISFGSVLSSLALGLLWAGSLATAMPLTGDYSKWEWPPAFWTNTVFIRTNAVITVVWAVIFLLQAAFALAGHYSPPEFLFWLVARYLLLVPGGVFTKWYQKWYPTYGSVREKRRQGTEG